MSKANSQRVCISFPFLFFLILLTCGCERPKEKTRSQAENHEEITKNDAEEAQEQASPKVSKTPTLDTADLIHQNILFSRQEAVNLSLKDTRFDEALSKGLKMMTVDAQGYRVLGGLRDDPTRYKYEGEVFGTIKRLDSEEIIATYKFRVVKILAGKTERLSDAYFACKGTYWVPVPVPKPDLPWEDVPTTNVWYEVPPSKIGVLLNTEKSIPREYLQEKEFSTVRDTELQFIFTSDFQLALFGKGSVHMPIE